MELIFDSLTGRHHHTTTDGINRIRNESRTNGHNVTKTEGGKETSIITQYNWFECIIEAEIATSIYNNTHTGYDETTVETLNTIRGQSFLVYIYKSIELTLSTLLARFSVVSKAGSGIVKGVYKAK